jgi:apolipoprotein N-acyltransferase
MWGVVPLPMPGYLVFAASSAFISLIPFLLDKLTRHRLPLSVQSLVFPAALVTLEFINSQGPFGTWGSYAYTQFGHLPLMQIAFAAGIWGITFLIGWLASVANTCWEARSVRPAILLGAVLAVVLFGGGWRLALTPAVIPTVPVAGLTVGWEASEKTLFLKFIQGKANPEETERFKQVTLGLQEKLFQLSEKAVSGGAKILLWSEGNGMVFEQNLPQLQARGANFARNRQLYLFMPVFVMKPGRAANFNQVMAYDPAGKQLFDYEKSRPGLGEPAIKGDGQIRWANTPYGKIACAICYDADFPSLIRQAGKARADILLLPSSDWKAIDPIHTQMAAFRAIENGFSLVRQTNEGLSMAVNAQGTVLSQMDFFATPEKIMLANVPVRGEQTLYAKWGDWLAWACLWFIVACTIWLTILKLKKPKGIEMENAAETVLDSEKRSFKGWWTREKGKGDLKVGKSLAGPGKAFGNMILMAAAILLFAVGPINAENSLAHSSSTADAKSSAQDGEQEKKPDAAGVDHTDLFRAHGLNNSQGAPKPFQFIPSIVPALGSNPGSGLVGGVIGNMGIYLGPLETTTISNIQIAGMASSKGQYSVSLMSDLKTWDNAWEFVGDWHYYIYNQPTFGLGTGPQVFTSDGTVAGEGNTTRVNGSQLIDFKQFGLHELILRRVGEGFYLGAGYDHDGYDHIVDRKLSLDSPIPEITAHYAYSTYYGFDPSQQTVSGFSAAALYDSRDSTINPYRGIYGLLEFTRNSEMFGSSQASSVIHSKVRAYIPTSSEIARNVLALSICAVGVVDGSLPYLALPSTGWSENSGRGYSQGRFRGPWEVYAESEWRFRITNNGLLGGVVFANLQTFSSPAFDSAGYTSSEVKLMQYVEPAVGTGLRVLLNRDSRANLAADFGYGRDGLGLWIQIGEFF